MVYISILLVLYTLLVFFDADWPSCPDDGRSTSGYCTYLGGNLVSWSSKKRGVVARFSTKSKYCALAHVTTEIIWLQALLIELGHSSSTKVVIWCDNQSAAALASNLVFHQRTKHIETNNHFVRDKVLQGAIDIWFVPTHDQVADIFTKPVPISQFLKLRSKLLVTSSLFSLRGDVTAPSMSSGQLHQRGPAQQSQQQLVQLKSLACNCVRTN